MPSADTLSMLGLILAGQGCAQVLAFLGIITPNLYIGGGTFVLGFALYVLGERSR